MSSRAPIPRTDRTQPSLISYNQRRMWEYSKRSAQETGFNTSCIMGIAGAVNPTVLQESLRRIAVRHDILRTTFNEICGQAVQLISKQPMITLHRLELQKTAYEVGIEKAQSRIQSDSCTRFDLRSASPIRATLIRLPDDELVFVLTMHHIITDGYSYVVLIQELEETYKSLLAGREPDLAELPIQYLDYAAWQRNYEQDPHLLRQYRFWRREAIAFPKPESIPTDWPRSKMRSLGKRRSDTVLTYDELSACKRFARSVGVTIWTVLLSAYKVALYQRGQQDAVVIVSNVENRTRPELKGVMGPIANLLPFCSSRPASESTYLQFVHGVEEVKLRVLRNQEIALASVIPDSDGLDALQQYGNIAFSLHEGSEWVASNSGSMFKSPSKDLVAFDSNKQQEVLEPWEGELSLALTETETGLLSDLYYNSTLFSLETVASLFGSFRSALCKIMTDPHSTIR